MKVAFLNQPWNPCPPLNGGSISIWIHEVAKQLAGTSTVYVLARSSPGQPKKESVRRVHYRRVSIAFDSWLLKLVGPFKGLFKPDRPLFASWLYYFGYATRVAFILRKLQPEIVHIQNFSQFLPVIRALNPRSKIVLHMHCEWLSQLDRRLIEKRLRNADLICGCSEYITEKIRQSFPHIAKRCHAIYNGVDVQQFVRASENGRRRDDKYVVLFVGRVSPEKGLHVLIDAMREVVAQLSEVELRIIGSNGVASRDFIIGLSDEKRVADLARFYNGNYFASLQEQIDSDLKEKVTFSGFVPHHELVSHYRDADLLVNPSFSESFGMSLIEAMACEVPTVATRIGGMTEIVEDKKTGALVEAGDAPALAEAIQRLVENADLRKSMGKAAAQKAIARYSWERISEGLLSKYENILRDG